MKPVALGIKSHIGWAAVVGLAGPAASAEVVAKRRIDIATTFDEGAVYHKGQELPFDRAEALIRASEEKFGRTAQEALADFAAELRRAGCEPVASGLVSGDGKTLSPRASSIRRRRNATTFIRSWHVPGPSGLGRISRGLASG